MTESFAHLKEKSQSERDATRLARSMTKGWMSHAQMEKHFKWSYDRVTNALHIVSLKPEFDVMSDSTFLRRDPGAKGEITSVKTATFFYRLNK